MQSNKNKLSQIYSKLMNLYGPQGWWPLLSHKGTNPTKTGASSGYHCGDYSFPHNEQEQFEICIGAILTQNTAWTNVELALNKLQIAISEFTPEAILTLSDELLKESIRPAGYFNQKSVYVRNIAAYFLERGFTMPPERKDILSVKGIGEETADAILLYAFRVPTFVIDAYTKRFLHYHKLITGNEKYRQIQALFHSSLPNDVPLFQEYHALLVEHGKRYFSRKPYGDTLRFLK